MISKKLSLSIILITIIMFMAGTVMAATTVGWVQPPDGSSYDAGTILGVGQPDGPITGQASASGTVGGTGLDLALVIDTSGSMGWSPDYTLNNYAKPAAIALVNALPEDTTSVAVIGFQSYANTYQVLTPLNPSKAAVIAAINSLYASGGTNIGAGVAQGSAELVAGHTAGRAMMQVVLSDGYGTYGGQAATAYSTHGIITHTVGVPGHDAALMQTIANDGHGIYTNVTNLGTLVSLFDGTGGNLVGLDHVDIQLADGTWIMDIATDGLGNFILPDQVIALGANTFTAYAYGDDGTSASAEITLYGTQGVIPEPSTMILLTFGLLGLAALGRKKF